MQAFPMSHILRSVKRVQDPNNRLRILTICRNNEKYISLLAQTNHDFYILPNTPWNNGIETCPSNVSVLTQHSPTIDYLICYDRAEQYDETRALAQQFQVPIIIVDRCSKSAIRPQHILERMKDLDLNRFNRYATLHIYNSQYIAESWKSDGLRPYKIIPLGIDTNKFKNENSPQSTISIDNNTVSQVGGAIAGYVNNLMPIEPTDHTNDNITVNESKYFINTNKNITIKTLEAMSAENVVLCLNTPDIANYIEHQKTGWLLNDINEIPQTLKLLEENDSLRNQIATQARQKIISEHPIDSFVSQWSEALNTIRGAIYHPVPM